MKPENFFKFLPTDPIRISIWVFIFSLLAISLISIRLCLYTQADVWENILVEAHGMLLDILVFGILILWLNRKVEIRLENKRYIDEIDDFRGWNSDEAAYRIRGSIKRLNKNGITAIDLFDCNLSGIDLTYFDLTGARLMRAKLINATLINTKFNRAALSDADLTMANLMGAELRKAKALGANFDGANIEGANLTEADLSYAIIINANFTNATLSNVRFEGAKYNRNTSFPKGMTSDEIKARGLILVS